jgi:Putative addiction module component
VLGRLDLKPLDFQVYTESMSMNLPLKEMTLQEKLAAMELLWEDLARSPESVESPDWHKDILDERRGRVAEGKARFVDWETAKKDIRNKIS